MYFWVRNNNLALKSMIFAGLMGFSVNIFANNNLSVSDFSDSDNSYYAAFTDSGDNDNSDFESSELTISDSGECESEEYSELRDPDFLEYLKDGQLTTFRSCGETLQEWIDENEKFDGVFIGYLEDLCRKYGCEILESVKNLCNEIGEKSNANVNYGDIVKNIHHEGIYYCDLKGFNMSFEEVRDFVKKRYIDILPLLSRIGLGGGDCDKITAICQNYRNYIHESYDTTLKYIEEECNRVKKEFGECKNPLEVIDIIEDCSKYKIPLDKLHDFITFVFEDVPKIIEKYKNFVDLSYLSHGFFACYYQESNPYEIFCIIIRGYMIEKMVGNKVGYFNMEYFLSACYKSGVRFDNLPELIAFKFIEGFPEFLESEGKKYSDDGIRKIEEFFIKQANEHSPEETIDFIKSQCNRDDLVGDIYYDDIVNYLDLEYYESKRAVPFDILRDFITFRFKLMPEFLNSENRRYSDVKIEDMFKAHMDPIFYDKLFCKFGKYSSERIMSFIKKQCKKLHKKYGDDADYQRLLAYFFDSYAKTPETLELRIDQKLEEGKFCK